MPGKTGEYRTTREVYKSVKRYDHKQFDEFCTRVYLNGFKDGRESVKGVDVSELLTAIGEVKGVGPALHGKIREALNLKFQDQEKRDAEIH